MADANEIQSSLRQLIAAAAVTNNKLEAVERRLENLEELQRRISSISREVDSIKEKQNDIEQESKAYLVRINGLSVSDTEMEDLGYEKAIMKKAYDKVIKPILTAAKNNGVIESSTSWSRAHWSAGASRISRAEPSPPPCVSGSSTGTPGTLSCA